MLSFLSTKYPLPFRIPDQKMYGRGCAAVALQWVGPGGLVAVEPPSSGAPVSQWAPLPVPQCGSALQGGLTAWVGKRGPSLKEDSSSTMVIKNGGLKKDQIFLQISWRATEKRHWKEKTSIVKSKIGEKNWVKHWAYWGKGGELKEGGTEREWSSDWIGPAWRSQKAPKVSFIKDPETSFRRLWFQFWASLKLDAIVCHCQHSNAKDSAGPFAPFYRRF